MSELKPVIGPMARFTASTYGLSIAQIPTKDLDVNLLGMMTSLEVVGAYRLAKTFMSAVWSLADPIFLAIYPEIAKLWARRDFPALRSFLKRSSLLFGAGGISMVGGAWLVVPIVIDLAMGPEFHESSGLFRWMVWGACLWMPFVWVNPLMLAAGRPDLTLWSAVIAAVVSLVLNLVAISFFAGQGAAIVYGFNTPLVVFIALVLARASGIWRELGSAQPKAG
jgi:O-antigen/teichoic acid export membrane protein